MSQPENELPPLDETIRDDARTLAAFSLETVRGTYVHTFLATHDSIGVPNSLVALANQLLQRQDQLLAVQKELAETKALLDFERRRANAFMRRNGEKFQLINAALAERDQARAELATARAEGLEEFRCDLQTTFRSYGLNSEPIPRDEIQLIVNREVDAFHRNGFPPSQPESAK